MRAGAGVEVRQRRICRFIFGLLKSHNIMSVATLRRDGYPEASTATYANDGLTLYFARDHDSQKARNIKYSPKVSLTIDRDYKDWQKIQGLSMGALARVLTRQSGKRHGLAHLAQEISGVSRHAARRARGDGNHRREPQDRLRDRL